MNPSTSNVSRETSATQAHTVTNVPRETSTLGLHCTHIFDAIPKDVPRETRISFR